MFLTNFDKTLNISLELLLSVSDCLDCCEISIKNYTHHHQKRDVLRKKLSNETCQI